jgi:uncharacterized protein YuzE
MIHTNYDPEADVLHVKFGPDAAKYDGSQEVAPGVFLEFDTDGKPIGIEIISVRLRGIDARERESLSQGLPQARAGAAE